MSINQVREDFRQVLWNSADQVLVRRLMDEYVPDHVKKRIVLEFEKIMSCRGLSRVVDSDR